jgi:CheY-like chemotaxis protein
MLIYVTAQSALGEDSKVGSIKVLLVSDWSENLARVKFLLRLSPHVVIAQTTEELNSICQDFYDFVVVDVGQEHIVDALREIRAIEQLQNTSVLVRAERLMEAYAMLSKYRAMPCSDFELMRLVTARTQEKSAARFHPTSSSQENPPIL